MHNLGENIKRRSISPFLHFLESIPPGYHALSSSHVSLNSRSLTQNMVFHDPGKHSIPTSPTLNPPMISNAHIASITRGESPAQVALPTRGTIASMGKNIAVGKSTVNTTPPSTNTVTPFTVPGKPTWVPPTVSQYSWGYTYLGN